MPKTNKAKNKKQVKRAKPYSALKIVIFLGLLFSIAMVVKSVDLGREENNEKKPESGLVFEDNVYLKFLFEIYDKVQYNYWEKASDEDLSNLYKAAVEKIIDKKVINGVKNKEEIKKLFNEQTANMKDEEKKAFAVNIAQIVLANLQPFGRSGLYTEKDEKALQNTVKNIDEGVNLYESLEVPEEATPEEVNEVYHEKKEELDEIIKDEEQPAEVKEEAKEKIAQIDRAYETLADENKKAVYDESGIESTAAGRLISPEVFYIQLKKMSPTTFEEFQQAIADADKGEELDSLILDLRGNVGGAIDLMQWFLGPFIGLDQYAYEFYHQGEKEPFKTKVGWLPGLVRYKKVVVLIDNATQSSAEIMAATLKKYNVGVLVGETTRGWGTVERVFNLDTQIDPSEKYSIFLVHRITLREDNQPIEGRGVDPTIFITDPDWKNQLMDYYESKKLVDAVEKVLE
ncbi:MAG: S41 family peptidase [Patescibacteria group bacterium]